MSRQFELRLSMRLRWLSKIAALIVLLLAAAEIGSYIFGWVAYGPQQWQALFHAYAEHMPALLAPGFQLSAFSSVLTIICDALPTLVMVLILLLAARLFFRVSRDEIWLQQNARALFWIGGLYIVAPLLGSLIGTLQGLILSIDMPPGQRALIVNIGLESVALRQAAIGLIIIMFGFVMREGCKLHEACRLPAA